MLADATVNRALPIVTVGAEVQSEPTLVSVIAVTAPPAMVAVAAAEEPPPPENATVGASTYNVPPAPTATEVTLPCTEISVLFRPKTVAILFAPLGLLASEKANLGCC